MESNDMIPCRDSEFNGDREKLCRQKVSNIIAILDLSDKNGKTTGPLE